MRRSDRKGHVAPHPDTIGNDRPRGASATVVATIVRGAVAIAVIAASAMAVRSCQQASLRNVATAGQLLQDALGGLFVGELTTRFVSMAPELSGGSALELATLRVPERLEREQVQRILGLQARAAVAIEVPVTYRYHVPWDHGWRITLTVVPAGASPSQPMGTAEDASESSPHPAQVDAARTPALDIGGAGLFQLCLVEAPALEPSLPPAIDTRELRIARTKDWALQRFPASMVDTVLAQLTPLTTQRAASAQYKALVRETARHRLAQFVRLWVLRQDEVQSQRPVQVIVRFADDEATIADPDPLRLPVEIR
jgi:hypothetical protein